MNINLISTLKDSMLEDFFPRGWDLARIDQCCSHEPDQITEPQPWWHEDFAPVACPSLEDFNVMMGRELATEIKDARDRGETLVLILPVGPMGMYRWAVQLLNEWEVKCDHVHGFNMDEWSDAQGNTLPPTNPAAFQYAMEEAFYRPLGKLTVPPLQRRYATKRAMPEYPGQIEKLRKDGARMVVVYGIGRVFHIAFWEPHFAGEYKTEADWKTDTHRVAAKLHPLTIEQNAITSFKSRTTLVSARANTIGPGIFLQADRAIGGCDGALGRGMMWQGMSLWVTLRHEPTTWIPSTFMPTLPGKLFFLSELAGPLTAECN